MKKFCVVMCFVFVCVQIFCCGCGYTNGEDKLLRIHVRADSDMPEAQAVKAAVVRAINCYLSSELSSAGSYDEAYSIVKARVSQLALIASEVLRRRGFGYSATATLSNEYFPARVYDGTVVESGYYDALIVRLGCGGGDNWWCVLYPQLCYTPTASDEVIYKSLFAELFGH